MHEGKIVGITQAAEDANAARLREDSERKTASLAVAQRAQELTDQCSAGELSAEELEAANRQSHRKLYGMLEYLWQRGPDNIGMRQGDPASDTAEKTFTPPEFPAMTILRKQYKEGHPSLMLATSDGHWQLNSQRRYAFIPPEKPDAVQPNPDLQAGYEDDCDTVERLFEALGIKVPKQFRPEPLLNDTLPSPQ
jgi:hypothetical protein